MEADSGCLTYEFKEKAQDKIKYILENICKKDTSTSSSIYINYRVSVVLVFL